MLALSDSATHLTWAVLALIFTVFIVCPAIYKRRQK